MEPIDTNSNDFTNGNDSCNGPGNSGSRSETYSEPASGLIGPVLDYCQRLVKKNARLFITTRNRHFFFIPKNRSKKVTKIKKYLAPGALFNLVPLAITCLPDMNGVFTDGLDLEVVIRQSIEASAEWMEGLWEKIKNLFLLSSQNKVNENVEGNSLALTIVKLMGFYGMMSRFLNVKKIREVLLKPFGRCNLFEIKQIGNIKI